MLEGRQQEESCGSYSASVKQKYIRHGVSLQLTMALQLNSVFPTIQLFIAYGLEMSVVCTFHPCPPVATHKFILWAPACYFFIPNSPWDDFCRRPVDLSVSRRHEINSSSSVNLLVPTVARRCVERTNERAQSNFSAVDFSQAFFNPLSLVMPVS